MRIKFLSSYADEHEGFKAHNEYDFVDMRKANYFVDHGLAVPVESVIETVEDKDGNAITNSKGEPMGITKRGKCKSQ